MTTDGVAARLCGLQAEHPGMLRRFLLRYTYGDREAAEDLLQETMIRAWRNPESVPSETDRARRWMFIVARNAAIDKLRARSSHPYEVNLREMMTPPPADDTVETVVALTSIRDAVNSLSEEYRTVLAELYWRAGPLAKPRNCSACRWGR